MSANADLIELFKTRALKFGDFTLTSGKKSTYYMDGKQITLHAEGLRLVSEGLLDLLTKIDYVAVGGMSIGADPIIGGMLTAASHRQQDLSGFMVRKEPKGHGLGRYIEGPVEAGQRVVIIDDVVTTAKSCLEAVDRAIEFGLEVVHVVGVVDRMEGGAKNIAARDLPFSSLLNITDFGIDPPQA